MPVESTQHRADEGNRQPLPTVSGAPGSPEEVLDAVFDFAENLLAQQRAFAKQMLRATSTDAAARPSGSPPDPPVGAAAHPRPR